MAKQRNWRRAVGAICSLFVLLLIPAAHAQKNLSPQKVFVTKPVLELRAARMRDTDDMCFWRHPTEPEMSTVIASDKYKSRLFVYDLSGATLQRVYAPTPGNIDIRSGFPFGGEKIDIVVHNQRSEGATKIRVHKVDPETRQLTSIDNGAIMTSENYGGATYHSMKTGRFYHFITSKRGHVEQYELFDDGNGKVAGKKVRAWKIGFSEGAVADDEAGKLFINEEDRGIWVVGAEPDDPWPGQLFTTVNESGFKRDAEGVTVFKTDATNGYLIASSQGNNSFKVYDRREPYAFAGTFKVQNVAETDGIDVINGNFGERFPEGIFACHTGAHGQRVSIQLVSWKDIAAGLETQNQPAK